MIPSGSRMKGGQARAARSRRARWPALRGQLLRKLVQISVLSLIAWTALGTTWRNYKVAHNSERIVALLESDATAWLYGRNQDLLALFGDPLPVSEGFLGLPWGMRIGGLGFTDPWSLVAVISGGQLPPAGMWLGVLVPLGIALVAGRLFCAWLCPARLVFELGGLVRQGLLRLGLPLGDVAIPPVGLWVGLGTALFAASAGAASFHFVLPYLGLGAAIFSLVLSGTLGAAGLAFAAMVAVDVLVAPGQICRSLCPTGALLGLVGTWAPWRLRKAPDAEVGRACPATCNLCQRACPYGLFPGRDAHFPGCDGCGRCTAVCPDTRLRRSLELRR
ncbi:MAG: 4Fe-4S binding protein [Alphaproteobacteria bacterium]|nr:4Fe-4S binding protein [Alphaproteobacteria bacterium]